MEEGANGKLLPGRVESGVRNPRGSLLPWVIARMPGLTRMRACVCTCVRVAGRKDEKLVLSDQRTFIFQKFPEQGCFITDFQAKVRSLGGKQLLLGSGTTSSLELLKRKTSRKARTELMAARGGVFPCDSSDPDFVFYLIIDKEGKESSL